MGKKNYAEALIDYRKAVAIDSTFGEARLKLAATYEIGGDERNALAQFIRAADLMPDNPLAQIYAAKHLLNAGRFPEAKARAIAALNKDPRNVAALILFGNALAGMQDVDGAIVQAKQAINAEPRVTFGYANLAAFEMQKGNAEAALSAFKRAVEVDPKSAQAHMNLGGFYWVTGKLLDAEQEFKAALALNPKAPDVNRLMATFYQMTGRRSQTEPYLVAYAAAGEGPTPKLALADFYLQDDRTKEAVDVLKPLAANKDGFGAATLRLAAIDFQANRKPQAYAALEDVLKQYPRNETTNETKARFLLVDKRYDEAIKVADAVIAANPQAATSHYVRGLALTQKGQVDDAIKAMQRVLELTPTAVVAQSELAKLHLARHDPKAAIQFLNVLLKGEPRNGVLHMLMGQALYESGDMGGAERELLPLAGANPKSADLQVWAGRIYSTKGDLASARKAFERALELQPGSLLGLNGIVSLDIAEKKSAAAKAALETALGAKGDDVGVLFLASNSFMTLGDNERAEQLLKKVVQLDPGHIDAYARLGRLYWYQGRLDEAKAAYETVAKHQDSPYIAKTFIGMILELQNRPDEAGRTVRAGARAQSPCGHRGEQPRDAESLAR